MTDGRVALEAALTKAKKYPRDVESAVLTTLPLSIVLVGKLSIEAVHVQLARRNIPVRCDLDNRPLRGCLVADGDVAFIFVDSGDPTDERRFTIAHEAAHFIVDYLEPRAKVLELFGERIRPVLDGRRTPTNEEKVDAHLARVPLQAHVHVMAREQAGQHAGCESRADALAYGIMAPAYDVRRKVAAAPGPGDVRAAAADVLVHAFGLPRPAAAEYATALYPAPTVTPLRTLLGL